MDKYKFIPRNNYQKFKKPLYNIPNLVYFTLEINEKH